MLSQRLVLCLPLKISLKHQRDSRPPLEFGSMSVCRSCLPWPFRHCQRDILARLASKTILPCCSVDVLLRSGVVVSRNVRDIGRH
jgi:hypothetical protein